MAKKYESIIDECAQTRYELDTVLHPTFGQLKKAFKLLFESFGYNGADFKKLSDLVYYQGGYPNPETLPKEEQLANAVSRALKLEDALGRETLQKLLKQRGIEVAIKQDDEITGTYQLNPRDSKKLEKYWRLAEIGGAVPDTRGTVLKKLIDRAQELQSTICAEADTIKVDAAAVVEEAFKIKKPNFVKAVGLAAVKLRKGEGKMTEKLDDLLEGIENLEEAVEPLKQSK